MTQVSTMEKDFEIKRLIIGLSALALGEKSHQLDQKVQQRYPDFMKAILFLCQKSLQIREKKSKKEEEAEEDKDCEKGVVYEDDDEGDYVGMDSEDGSEYDMDSDEDELANHLYDTKLDEIDEILYVSDCLSKLQQINQEYYQYVLNFYTPEEQQGLQHFIQTAMADKQNKDALEAQRQAEQAQTAPSNVQQIDLNQA